MNEIIDIHGPGWKMTITYRFFPASSKSMKKLLKYIDMDYANAKYNYMRLYDHLADYVEYGGMIIFGNYPSKQKMIKSNYDMVLKIIRERGYT